jgi:hypothetical protein
MTGMLSKTDIERLSTEEQQLLAGELERQYWQQGRKSFRDYVGMIEVPGAPLNDDETEFFPERVTPAAHHELLIQAVQDFADGKNHDVDGFMVFWPPGAAKSTYLSVLASSWLLGRAPRTNVIGASYAQPLANRFSRRVRSITKSAEYAKIFEASLSQENRDVESWALTNGSDYRAAGLSAGITGFRADYALIDDPVKGREEADSEVIREKVWETFNDDVDTRLKPGGKIFIAMTRWHEDDLAGRILGETWKGQSGLWRGTDGKLWLVINLPLLAEHADDPLGRKLAVHEFGGFQYGELLWPDWFRLEDAQRRAEQAKKGGTFARTWSSLFQQRPAPSEGAILNRTYWREWTKKELPEVDSVYLCYDTAFEEDEVNDFSAMTAWGQFRWTSKKRSGEEYVHQHVILLGGWQERMMAPDLVDRVKEDCKLFKPDRVLIEKRASGIQLLQELHRQRIPAKPWLPRGRPGSKGKVPRAHAVAAILEQGSCWHVPGRICDKILDQCAAFPHGTHDDWVDTVTMALAYFRDRYIFQTADDELSEEELKDALKERADNRSRPRNLYGNRDSNRSTMAGSKRDFDLDDIERMTPATRRKLYSDWT